MLVMECDLLLDDADGPAQDPDEMRDDEPDGQDGVRQMGDGFRGDGVEGGVGMNADRAVSPDRDAPGLGPTPGLTVGEDIAWHVAAALAALGALRRRARFGRRHEEQRSALARAFARLDDELAACVRELYDEERDSDLA